MTDSPETIPDLNAEGIYLNGKPMSELMQKKMRLSDLEELARSLNMTIRVTLTPRSSPEGR